MYVDRWKNFAINSGFFLQLSSLLMGILERRCVTMRLTIIWLLAIAVNVVLGSVVPTKGEEEDLIGDDDNANIKEAPYLVYIMRDGAVFTTGNIIHKRVVLGLINYDVYDESKKYSIEYGFPDLDFEDNSIDVAYIITDRHTFYSPNFQPCLFVLESDIPFSTAAEPIPLATTAPTVDSIVELTIGISFPEYNNFLIQNDAWIRNMSLCEKFHSISMIEKEKMLCVVMSKYETEDCQIFSKNSMVSYGGEELVGISAREPKCDSMNYYGVYFNVAWFKPVIDFELENIDT